MRRSLLPIFRLLSIGLLTSTWAQAEVSDPAAARAQLQQGYALKQQGKCGEALPHFAESVRLDRQPKALLNLADCEAKSGKLVSAQAHTVEARDLARTRGMADFEKFAIGQLKEIDERMPKLVITVTAGAPAGTVVTRDGAELGAISLGTPLPIDPGPHTVVARGGGLEHAYPFSLAEREAKKIDVTPVGGTVVPTPAEPQHLATESRKSEPSASVEGSSDLSTTSALPSQRIAALGLAGAGLVAFGVSYGLGSAAQKSWKEAHDGCLANVCNNPADVQQASSARERGNVATAVFVIGAASLVTGGVLWFTAHREEKTALQFSPQAGPSYGGVAFRGAF